MLVSNMIKLENVINMSDLSFVAKSGHNEFIRNRNAAKSGFAVFRFESVYDSAFKIQNGLIL